MTLLIAWLGRELWTGEAIQGGDEEPLQDCVSDQAEHPGSGSHSLAMTERTVVYEDIRKKVEDFIRLLGHWYSQVPCIAYELK